MTDRDEIEAVATDIQKVIENKSYLNEEDFVKELTETAIKALDAHREKQGQRSNGWVKIEDIPKEWKDGRPIDLWYKDIRYANCSWSKGDFYGSRDDWVLNDRGEWLSEITTKSPTHAMLPTPPEE